MIALQSRVPYGWNLLHLSMTLHVWRMSLSILAEMNGLSPLISQLIHFHFIVNNEYPSFIIPDNYLISKYINFKLQNFIAEIKSTTNRLERLHCSVLPESLTWWSSVHQGIHVLLLHKLLYLIHPVANQSGRTDNNGRQRGTIGHFVRLQNIHYRNNNF